MVALLSPPWSSWMPTAAGGKFDPKMERDGWMWGLDRGGGIPTDGSGCRTRMAEETEDRHMRDRGWLKAPAGARPIGGFGLDWCRVRCSRCRLSPGWPTGRSREETVQSFFLSFGYENTLLSLDNYYKFTIDIISRSFSAVRNRMLVA
jgi:hypothetical protein